ncbi:MAG TPA: hypothetical protein VN408_20470, partial [Actinoplanes sp.]|nr:hypothetical protein [Actinoplanes sp.]
RLERPRMKMCGLGRLRRPPAHLSRDRRAEQVVAWLSSADLRLTLFAAFDAADSEETLQTLADIDDLV